MDETPTKTRGVQDGASPEPPVGELVQLEGASAGPAMMDVSLADNGDFMTAPSTPNNSMTVSVPAQLPVTPVQVNFFDIVPYKKNFSKLTYSNQDLN